MGINKKGLAVCLLCYVLWGTLPAYWNLLSGVNPLLILCGRIFFAFLFTMGLLAVSGRAREMLNTLKDKKKMRCLIPSSMLITFNWGLYIWAVNNGRIFDASLGYYMLPLMSFVFGLLIFREKSTKLQLAAIALAFAGVMISVIAFGNFPVISLGLALSFMLYGALKRVAGADPVAGIAIESLLFSPFALVLAFVFLPDSVRAVSAVDVLLLIGGGALTAVPLILFSRAVSDIPFIVVGFLQYLSPSLTLTYGLIIGEMLSASQIVSFAFIGLGLVLFSIAIVRKTKKSLT